jgi:hypothetical protein
MAIIIPFSPTRFDSIPFSEKPFTQDPMPRFRVWEDAEGSGYTRVEMLLPPRVANSAIFEMMERYMSAAVAEPKPKSKRKTRRRA